MAVGIPDGETPEGIIEHFLKRFGFLKIKNMVPFMVKNHLKRPLLIYQRQYNDIR